VLAGIRSAVLRGPLPVHAVTSMLDLNPSHWHSIPPGRAGGAAGAERRPGQGQGTGPGPVTPGPGPAASEAGGSLLSLRLSLSLTGRLPLSLKGSGAAMYAGHRCSSATVTVTGRPGALRPAAVTVRVPPPGPLARSFKLCLAGCSPPPDRVTAAGPGRARRAAAVTDQATSKELFSGSAAFPARRPRQSNLNDSFKRQASESRSPSRVSSLGPVTPPVCQCRSRRPPATEAAGHWH
jgi:hypothetical protein